MTFECDYPRRASRSGGNPIDIQCMEKLVGSSAVIIYKNQFWKIEKSTPKLFILRSFLGIRRHAKKNEIGDKYKVKFLSLAYDQLWIDYQIMEK
jgi:hypothetical protein